MNRNANWTIQLLRAGYENQGLPARERPAELPAAAQDSWLNGLVCRSYESHAATFQRTIREAADARREAANSEVRAALRAIRENAPTYPTADPAAATVA